MLFLLVRFFSCTWWSSLFPQIIFLFLFLYGNAEIGKAEQAYGPLAPVFQKLWAISKKYGPWQLWDGPEVKKKKYWYFSKGCNF